MPLALGQRCLGPRARDAGPHPIGQFLDELDLVLGPATGRRIGGGEHRDQPAVLDQRHGDRRAHADLAPGSDHRRRQLRQIGVIAARHQRLAPPIAFEQRLEPFGEAEHRRHLLEAAVGARDEDVEQCRVPGHFRIGDLPDAHVRDRHLAHRRQDHRGIGLVAGRVGHRPQQRLARIMGILRAEVDEHAAPADHLPRRVVDRRAAGQERAEDTVGAADPRGGFHRRAVGQRGFPGAGHPV